MRKTLLLILTLLIAFITRCLVFFPSQKSSYRAGQEIKLVTTLSGEPQVFGKSQKFKTSEGIEVVVGRYPTYHYGDRLEISGILKTKSSSQASQALEIKQSDLELVFPQVELIEKGEGNWLMGKIFSLRQKLIANYQDFLPEPASSLLVGIVLGVKTQMSPGFKETLRKTGLTHVVVASGMNVTLVAGFLNAVLITFLRRQLVVPFVLLGIFFYALLAGFEPPIVRAVIMGALAFTAQSFGRQNWTTLSLVLAGFSMLFINPFLVFDLGFQLSFLATSGLIFIQPILEKIRMTRPVVEIPLLGQSLTTTLAAQIATLPVILANFGYYSFLSIFANSLILWTIPWIMGIGGIAGILGLIFKPAGLLLSLIAYALLAYFEKIAFLFARLDFLSLKIDIFPFFFSLAYFSFLVAVLIWRAGKKEIE